MKQPDGEPTVTRLTDLLVKSVIAWPADNLKLPAGRHSVKGFAWTGSGLVHGVEFSGDGGKTWIPAKLESSPKGFGWVRWNLAWSAPPGDHILMSRATDSAGRRQPILRDPLRKDGYELNFCAPVRCAVR